MQAGMLGNVTVRFGLDAVYALSCSSKTSVCLMAMRIDILVEWLCLIIREWL